MRRGVRPDPAAAVSRYLSGQGRVHRDLWIASSSSGGTATRLTAHPGLELFAKFSPDGKWIAFTGQYDGDEQVYVIPSTGGVPKQLTFYPARRPFPPRWGYDNQVYGWTPDGKSVFFRSLRDGWDHGQSRIYTVPVEGGLGEPLPMPQSGGADLSPDGRQVVYTPSPAERSIEHIIPLNLFGQKRGLIKIPAHKAPNHLPSATPEEPGAS